MKRVLIVEDKEESREILVRMIREIDAGAAIYTAENEDEAYCIAMKKTIGVFLLDIILHPEHTGDQSGAVFAQNIREVEKYFFTPIIFITTLYDSQMCMFHTVQCYGFIEKPFDMEKTKKIIANAMRYHTVDAQEKSFIFHTEGLLQSVPLKEIMYIESKNHKLYVHTEKERFTIPYRSCKRVWEELDSDEFQRCNRGTIVNMRYIDRIDAPGRYIYLKTEGKAIEIGSTVKKSFLENFRKREV
ncbi:MAG: LytTR family DNA-binding domain-containing protein [Roseburia sp.]|nr:LytTR family DNA-binding domain-containing protein [Roseburia sp.]